MRWEQFGPEAHKASALLPKGPNNLTEAISSFTLQPDMMALIDEQHEMVQWRKQSSDHDHDVCFPCFILFAC